MSGMSYFLKQKIHIPMVDKNSVFPTDEMGEFQGYFLWHLMEVGGLSREFAGKDHARTGKWLVTHHEKKPWNGGLEVEHCPLQETY